LSGIARDTARNANERLSATNILAACAPDRPELLTPVLIDGSEEQFAVVFPLLTRLGPAPLRFLEAGLELATSDDPTDPQNELAAQRKARAAIALLRLGYPERVWPLFKQSRDERVRSYLINWSRRLGVDPQVVLRRWTEEKDVGTRSALLLLLGEFPDGPRPEGQRQDFIKELLATFEKEPDPGLHAASQWLLRRWNCDARLQAVIERLRKNEAQRRADQAHDPEHRVPRRQWYVNRQGQTFVIVDARQSFMMGSPPGEPEREVPETQHERKIGRRYAIAASPVTKEQFKHFLDDRPNVAKRQVQKNLVEKIAQTDDSPNPGMTWFEAAEYCNWLSEKEGISRDQWCYEPNEQGEFAGGMQARDKFLVLTGYRLPTEAEWEFACRAGTVTRFYFGQNDALLANYAWYRVNSGGCTRPVASLKPNDLGLFDMLGNVWQWCECPIHAYPEPGRAADDDCGAAGKIASGIRRVVRGGAYDNLPGHVRAAYRGFQNPDARQPSFGFRPARTVDF
jgi:formylglycine-generating enzyme required for sulfatase activity